MAERARSVVVHHLRTERSRQVITILAFFFVANYILSFISLFVLRRREPDKAATVSRVGLSMTTGLALIGSLLFLAGAIV